MASAPALTFSWENIPEKGENNVWYYPDDTCDSVIVFVHGILSDSRGCWLRVHDKDEAQNRYWPQLIRSDRRRIEDVPVFLAGYYTHWDAGPLTGTRSAANSLYQALSLPNAAGRKPVMARRNIVFICHSTGGIVARYMLDNNAADFKDKNVGLLLMASPSYGSKLANLTAFLLRLLHQELGKELKWGNALLRDLDDRFHALVNDRRIPNLVGYEAYESHFVFRRWWFPPGLFVVDKQAALRYFSGDVLANTDHFTCVKPDKLEHPAHLTLLDFLRRFHKHTGAPLGAVAAGSTTPAAAAATAGASSPGVAGSVPPAAPAVEVKKTHLRLQMAPAVPKLEFLARDEEFRRGEQILTPGRTLAVVGGCGSGKTTLATRLGQSPKVTEALPDGTFWAGFRGDVNVAAIAATWCAEMGLSGPEVAVLSEEERLLWLRERLRNARALLVIEDAVDPPTLLLGGKNCAHLVTTESNELATAVAGENVITLSALSTEDRVRMLTGLLPNQQKLPAEALRAAEKLPETPLGISLFATATSQESVATLLGKQEPAATSAAEWQLPRLAKVGFEGLPEHLQIILRKLVLFPFEPNTFSEIAAIAITEAMPADLDALTSGGLLGPRPPGRYCRTLVPLPFSEPTGHTEHAARKMLEFYAHYLEVHAADFNSLAIERNNIAAALAAGLNYNASQSLYARAANSFVGYLMSQGEYESASDLCSRAALSAEVAGESAAVATALLNQGRISEKRGNYADAISDLQTALEQGQQFKLGPEFEGNVCEALAVVYQNDGDNDRSAKYLDRGLNLPSQDPQVRADLLSRRAVLKSSQGKYDEAEADNLAARELARRIRSRDREALILTNLGVLEYRRGNYDKARAYDLEGLDLARAIGHREREAGLLQALGGLELATKNFTAAEQDLRSALELAESIGHRWYTALIRKILGDLYLATDRIADARREYETSMQLLDKGGVCASARFGLARVFEREGNLPAAKLEAEKSLAELQTLGDYEAETVAAWIAQPRIAKCAAL